MGVYSHQEFAEVAPALQPLETMVGLLAESEFEFFSRRALEESRLAQRATSPAAANAHRYLAAVYSERLAKHISVEREMEDLLRSIP